VSELGKICGHLVLGGFSGTTLPPEYAAELAAGRRAGAVLFKRNLAFVGDALDLDQVAELNHAMVASTPKDDPPFIAVDQEGGRVARLGAPVMSLPPMRAIGDVDDVELTQSLAEELGRQLGALGFNLDFAPVMDVDSNPENPVIGDRSFGRDPRTVMRHGVAFVRGLQSVGVLACAKHYPGHGDTALDSHFDLPAVDQPRARLMQIELPPFRAASGAGVASMMTAHVVYPALEAGVPATFSSAICSDLLRGEIGFEGVLFSDDLEMGAIAKNGSIEDGAVRAIDAGCDVLLVCSDLAAQARVHEALVRRAETDAAFAARCRQAAERSRRIRRMSPPRPERDSRRIREVLTSGTARELLDRLASIRTRVNPPVAR
jgi:beta-N-acetylhexosaminidase